MATKDREDPDEARVVKGDVMQVQSVEAMGRPGGATGAPPPGGKDTFHHLVKAHLPALLAHAEKLCQRQPPDPDDIVQDAMVRAFRAREQVKEPDRVRGWLLRIVTNTFLDSLRRRRVRPGEVPLEDDHAAPPGDAPSMWDRLTEEDVKAAIEQLPDDVRETFRRFTLLKHDYVQIAAELNIKKSTVGTRIMRARKRMRVLLAARLGDSHA